MKKWSFIGWLLGVCFIHTGVLAQGFVVSPVVPDFTDINANCVVGTSGTTDDPYAKKGIVPEHHQVISGQGFDPYTGDGLKLLPEGEHKVVKLGNSSVWAEAESITYHFMVDPAKAVLLLKFAVVFQDPSHEGKYQPRFIVRIMNKEGELIDACAEYDVSARPGIEGFHTFDKLGTPVRWRDWTNVGLDMSAYAGQEVQVQFVTYDCALNAHFGYAYFTASCISHRLAFENCKDDEFSISAPGGFASYEWQDGRTQATTTWTKGEEAMNLACKVTSATGCSFTLSAYVSSKNDSPTEPRIYDTICQGEAYKKYNYDLPAQVEPGTFRYTNTHLDLQNCVSGGETELFLTVLQRYYPIVEELCPGESYVDHGFSYVDPAPGVYFDTLSYLKEDGRCDSVVTLHLTVFPEVSMSNDIKGDGQPCVGSIQTYSISENWNDNSYSWQFPEGYYILDGQGTKEVLVQVTDAAKSGTVSLMFGTKGCAFGLRPFTVEAHPAYWKTLEDTVCTGLEYREKGFNIPRQNTPGIKSFTQYNFTEKGCDSIVTLNLYVFPTPNVRIAASDSVVCEGDPVKLEALGDGATIGFDSVAMPIAIGDILCTDGSVVKLKDYRPGRHVAKGIIFQVDKGGRHGWAVHLQDQALACRWNASIPVQDIAGLSNRVNNRTMATDTSGYRNTSIIRATGGASVFEAAYLVDFSNGWYVPAMGQLLQLYPYIPEINAAIAVVGGVPFDSSSSSGSSSWYYWSSTEFDEEKVWGLTLKGYGGLLFKYPTEETRGRLRAVCSF